MSKDAKTADLHSRSKPRRDLLHGRLAPILGTAALVVAVAGVVFAPRFVGDELSASQPMQAQSPTTATALALR